MSMTGNMSPAEKAKERRSLLFAQGLCQICASEPRGMGTRCAGCREKNNAARRTGKMRIRRERPARVFITINGKTLSVKEWSEQPGAAKYRTILQRINVSGWPAERAVFDPLQIVAGSSPKPRPRRIRLVGVNRESRAGYVPLPKRPALILAPNPRVPNPHPPTWGGFSSWPIEALEMLRRCA